MHKPIPISFYTVKIHSRCNLNCTYCFEYNLGNDSWKSKPKEMSLAIFKQLVERIKEHAIDYHMQRFSITFHGGEPLLRKPKFFEEAAEICRVAFEGKFQVDLGVQTNATIVSLDHIKVFKKYGIFVGTSLDGPPEINDKFRIYKNGDGSHDDALKGLNLLRLTENKAIWGGNLSVINVKSSPKETYKYLSSLNPPTLDFLEPDAHWEKFPLGKASAMSTEYGDWLIELFDIWFDNDSEIPIRKFDTIIREILGTIGTAEYFGISPVSLITISTDGDYEAVDQIKVVGEDAEKFHLNVFDNALDDVFNKKLFMDRQKGFDALSDECKKCEFSKSCGGGYFPHRYSHSRGFLNPSVYCSDYKKLFTHIRNKIQKEINHEL